MRALWRTAVPGRLPAQGAGKRRKQHQNQHHDEVLDNQPAYRDATGFRADGALRLKCPE